MGQGFQGGRLYSEGEMEGGKKTMKGWREWKKREIKTKREKEGGATKFHEFRTWKAVPEQSELLSTKQLKGSMKK